MWLKDSKKTKKQQKTKNKKLQFKVQIHVKHYINKTVKIMVNKYHALIFNDKRGETIIEKIALKKRSIKQSHDNKW